MSGDGDRLLADALHQVAVRGEYVSVVVDHVAELGRQHALCERHADRRREPLTQRTGRRLDPERVTVFGMAGRLGAELAERLQILDRQAVAAAHSSQIEQGIEQGVKIKQIEIAKKMIAKKIDILTIMEITGFRLL